jgi:probable F420-dependent oxidoreductase
MTALRDPSASRGIKIGVGPSGIPEVRAGTHPRVLSDFFRRIENLGYDSIAVGDHLDNRGAPLLMLAAASQVTSRIALMSLVLCNEFRNTTVLVQEARTLAVLSGGRFELGLGVGWMKADFEQAGIPFGSFDSRLEHLVETVGAVRDGVDPAPTIVVGGGGPKMLAASARVADIVTFNIPLGKPRSIREIGIAQGVESEFEERIRIVTEAAAAAGRTVEHHIYVHDLHLGSAWESDAAAAAERVGLDLDDYLASPHVLAGEPDRISATLRDRERRYRIGYVSIPAGFAEPFAPVLELLRT